MLQPLPLREPGRYSEIEKPEWKAKSYPKSYTLDQSLPLSHLSCTESPEGLLVYQTAAPSSLQEFKQYCDYVTGQGDRPSFLHEFTRQGFIRFCSVFESGNLAEAYHLFADSYALYLRADTNNQGNTQWFYFSASNQTKHKVRLDICNIKKPSTLYKKGLRPWVFSSAQGEWEQLPEEVEFFKKKNGYILSFSYRFAYENDTVYFSFALPYTFSKLNVFLKSIEPAAEVSYTQEELCQSMGGLPVYKLKITASSGLPMNKRRTIVLTARVHPGETNSSYVMEGAVKFLMSPHAYAQSLRKHYIFVIVPMLNPDGVTCGNSRCGFAGVDLNRKWDFPDAEKHPSIFHTKKMISKLKVLLFCDFHAHSNKMGGFLYGCHQAAQEGFTSWTKVRLFPRIMANFCTYFEYKNCKFKVEPNKEGTGRVVMWKEFGITNSFTLECSIFAFKKNVFYKKNLFEFGSLFMVGLHEYHSALKSLELELKVNGGWLKPNRLIELSTVNKSKKLKSIGKDWRSHFNGEELLDAWENQQEDLVSSGSENNPSGDTLENNCSTFNSSSLPSTENLREKDCRPEKTNSVNDVTRNIFLRKKILPKKLKIKTDLHELHPINIDLGGVYTRNRSYGKQIRKHPGFLSTQRQREDSFECPLLITCLKESTEYVKMVDPILKQYFGKPGFSHCLKKYK